MTGRAARFFRSNGEFSASNYEPQMCWIRRERFTALWLWARGASLNRQGKVWRRFKRRCAWGANGKGGMEIANILDRPDFLIASL